MSALAEYQTIMLCIKEAKDWVALYGSTYHGGGGGVGHISHCSYAKIEIYHQERNGSRNYHKSPDSLSPYINKVLISLAPKIIKEAIEEMESQAKRLSVAAKLEADAILIAHQ